MTRRSGFFWILISLLALIGVGLWWGTSCGGTCWLAGGDARDQCIRDGGDAAHCDDVGTNAQMSCLTTSSRCQ